MFLPTYEEWRRTIAEMGLEELDNPQPRVWNIFWQLPRMAAKELEELDKPKSPMVVGNYRSHHVKIYEEEFNTDALNWHYPETVYDVEFTNPQHIMLGIKKRSLLPSATWSRHPFFIYSRNEDIKTGDPEFDAKYSVKGNREDTIRAVLNQSIRDKITRLEDFNLIIGFSTPPGYPQVFDTDPEQVPANTAQHIDYQTFSQIKRNPKRFRVIIDILIDIAEKAEAYANG